MTRSTGALVLSPLALDRASPIPLYFQVAGKLQEQIESGAVPVGARLGKEVDLADQMGVSRPTMRRAIQYLVERGLLVRKRGIGTEVLDPKLRRPIELTSLFDDLVRDGRTPHTEVRRLEVVPASDTVSRALGLPEGAEVTWLERLRFSGEKPIALMHNAVPVDLVHLDADDLVSHGLYELLRAAGHAPRIASQVIGARPGTAAETRTLAEHRGAALLTMTRTAWDATGRAVEYGSHIYPASRYSFELNLTGA